MDDFVIIQANPGFNALEPNHGEDMKFNGVISRIPIIAWKITDGENVKAICMDTDADPSSLAISAPGDLYIADGQSLWNSLHEYIDYLYAKDKE